MGNWAFSWVQVVAHNRRPLLMLWSVLSLVALYGLLFLEFNSVLADALLLLTGVAVISLVVGFMLESLKIAVLQFGLSILVVLLSLGGLGWSGYPLDSDLLLALMVLMTLLSSNLVHILSTLAREMARGLFQYDAVAESLKLNTTPILLSNLTTALGFVFIAWVEPQFWSLAWLVVLGAIISFIISLTWLPIILLNWLLEFRVGNTADRHGLKVVTNYLQNNLFASRTIAVLTVVMTVLLLSLHWRELVQYQALFSLVLMFAVLFWVFWKSLALVAMNLIVNLLALLVSISLFLVFYDNSEWVWLIWVLPLGLIVDDGIHFFSRYSRAQQTVFSDSKSAVVFAMSSVARPIWITTWVLISGFSVLLFSSSEMVVQSAVLILISLVVATALILVIIPAFIFSRS